MLLEVNFVGRDKISPIFGSPSQGPVSDAVEPVSGGVEGQLEERSGINKCF
jgi:hypothetical protein